MVGCGRICKKRPKRCATANHAAKRLQDGLTEIQRAVRIETRPWATEPLAKRFSEDPVRTAILISTSETCRGFASGLFGNDLRSRSRRAADFEGQKGATCHAGARGDPAPRNETRCRQGLNTPGIILATRPRAIVDIANSRQTSATPAPFWTLATFGSFLNLGRRVVCVGGAWMWVLARQEGGSGGKRAIGLMGGPTGVNQQALSPNGDGAGIGAFRNALYRK